MGTITEMLEPGPTAAKPTKSKKPARHWRLVNNVVATAEQLCQVEIKVQTRVFGVLKVSARLAQAAVHQPDGVEELDRLARRAANALRNLETTLERAQHS